MNNDKINKIADEYLKKMEDDFCEELIYIDDETIEENDFIVLFYNSKKFLKTGDISDMLMGNAPIIISKNDGKIYETGTAFPIEHYIKNYKKYGDPHAKQEKLDDDYKPVDDPRVMTKKEVNDVLDKIAENHNKKR